MVACGGVCVYRSPGGGAGEMGSLILSIAARRALWPMYSVRSVVVVVAGNWGVFFGMRISQ